MKMTKKIKNIKDTINGYLYVEKISQLKKFYGTYNIG